MIEKLIISTIGPRVLENAKSYGENLSDEGIRNLSAGSGPNRNQHRFFPFALSLNLYVL